MSTSTTKLSSHKMNLSIERVLIFKIKGAYVNKTTNYEYPEACHTNQISLCRHHYWLRYRRSG